MLNRPEIIRFGKGLQAPEMSMGFNSREENKQKAFQDLIRPLENTIIFSIGKIIRDADEADDALQNALLKIWKSIDSIIRHPNPRALVLRICANAAYDLHRKKNRYRKREIDKITMEKISGTLESADKQLEQKENREQILNAMSRLPGKQAEVVIMRFLYDCSYKEIAQSMGCKESTTRKHLQRAREKLKKQLKHLYQ